MNDKCIPFFWDERHNLVEHLGNAFLEDLSNFLKNRRTELEKALRTHDRDPVTVLYKIFK